MFLSWGVAMKRRKAGWGQLAILVYIIYISLSFSPVGHVVLFFFLLFSRK